ncbi:hydroxymethylbilane synthase [Sporolactobacillus sp. THM7-7]|nr:hydroxymethylbilane synthase [Sporolactobacillus sp. THM7-7]
MKRTIRVGSRKSKLALVQSRHVIDVLSGRSPDFDYEIRHIVTKGDKILHVTLSKVGGKGLFVKEIERALLAGKIDFAVHSMKDVPAELPDGLEIASVPEREDPRDVLLSRTGVPFRELAPGSVVGTSSLRRAAQLLHARPDLSVRPVRGNVDTRVGKLRAGEFDAIVLAAAGIKRMGWQGTEPAEYLPHTVSLPAVGQGALAVECRSDDAELKALLKTINDAKTAITVSAERAFLKRLNGSCKVPIAALCEQNQNGTLSLTGVVATPDGKTVLKTRLDGNDPETLGNQAAEELIAKGADKILSELT